MAPRDSYSKFSNAGAGLLVSRCVLLLHKPHRTDPIIIPRNGLERAHKYTLNHTQKWRETKPIKGHQTKSKNEHKREMEIMHRDPFQTKEHWKWTTSRERESAWTYIFISRMAPPHATNDRIYLLLQWYQIQSSCDEEMVMGDWESNNRVHICSDMIKYDEGRAGLESGLFGLTSSVIMMKLPKLWIFEV